MRSFVLILVLLGSVPLATAQIERLPRPEVVQATQYGAAVDFDGDRVVVGASGEASCGENAGAAYVYDRNEQGSFVLAARLTPKDCQPEQFFGRYVALDGDRVVIAAAAQFFNPLRPNAAYIFERQPDGSWAQTGKLAGLVRDDEGAFAACVAISDAWALVTAEADPATGAVGAAYLYRRVGQGWKFAERLQVTGPPRSRAGASCAFDTDRFVVAAPSTDPRKSGSLFVFAAASPPDASASDPPSWVFQHRIDGLRGQSLPVALDGGQLLVGEPGADRRAGRATLFAADQDGAWQRAATLEPAQDYDQGGFGLDVALNGGRALVVGYAEQLDRTTNVDRVVYSFVHDEASGTWRQRQIFDLGRYAFGAAVSLVGREALVGEAASEAVGAAYLVRLM
ncbi:MAG: hypothetical protein AAGG50_05155 [Bacteroidota bacterium]